MNQVILVGRLTADPSINDLVDGKKVTSVVIAVQRPFKNTDGLYETDFIRCVLWNSMATNTVEYCKKGDIVAIKGRLQNNNYETSEGVKKSNLEVIAEKITFVASKKDKE